ASFAINEGRIDTKSYQAMLSNTRSFGPLIVNEFRFGYTGMLNDLVGQMADVRNVHAELGIQGMNPTPNAWGPPSISLGNGLGGFGDSVDAPWVIRNHIFQVLDNVS